MGRVALRNETFDAFEAWIESLPRVELEDLIHGYPAHYRYVVLWTAWLVGTVTGGQLLHRVNEAQRQKVLDFGGEPLVKEVEGAS